MGQLRDVLRPNVAPTTLGTGTIKRTQSAAGAVQRMATECISFSTKSVASSFSVVLLAMRSASPDSSAEINKIGTLFGVARAGNGNFSIDLGNLYGSANQYYAGGSGGLTCSAWVNGVDYTSSGFTSLVNNRWYGFGSTVSGFGGTGGIYFGKDPAFYRGGGLYQLMGGAVACCFVFDGVLSSAAMAKLTRNPLQLIDWPTTRRRVLATTGTPHTATPGAGAETYAGQGATVKAGATLLPGAGAETYAGKQAAVTAGVTVAVGAGTETYQGLGAGVTQPATVAVGAGLVEVLGLQAALGSGLSGRVVRRGRYRTWDDVPTELAPVVSLAENYADELAVQRAVDDALARFAAMKAKTSIARRERLVDDLKRAIVAAVEEAAETDDEDALIALL